MASFALPTKVEAAAQPTGDGLCVLSTSQEDNFDHVYLYKNL